MRAGDAILLSGDLGRHGVAVLAARSELAIESPVESDSAPLCGPVQALLASGAEIHCLRDLTRGGLAAALIEIAEFTRLDVRIEERAILVSDPVRSACELLGFDPLHLANEGRFVAWVAGKDADRALAALRGCAQTEGAGVIGSVIREGHGVVTLRIPMGAERALDMLAGEQLPRIC